MSLTLNSQIEDLFEKGVINILRAIPGTLPEDERLAFESVIYIAYGYYRTYRRLEAAVIANTNDQGEPSNDPGFIREVFGDVWSLVDSAYALKQIASLPLQSRFLALSDETVSHMEAAAHLRNYMDHLRGNFGNSVKASNWFPLFGWITYQFTPCARSGEYPPDYFYNIALGSTHLRGETSWSARDHSTVNAIGEIDHVTLHLRGDDFCDLTKLLVFLALDMNAYSMGVQTYLAALFNDERHRSEGLMTPFPFITVRADLGTNQTIILEEIKSILDKDNIRMEVHIDTEN